MDFLGLIWAVYLPNQSLIPISPDLVYQDLTNPYASLTVKDQDVPWNTAVPDPQDFPPSGSPGPPAGVGHQLLPVSATNDHDPAPVFKPQLKAMAENTVDWTSWNLVSAVTVLPNSQVQTRSKVSPDYCTADAAYGRPTHPKHSRQASSRGVTVQVNGMPIGQVQSQRIAEALAIQLRQVLPTLEDQAEAIQPLIGEDRIGIGINGQFLVDLTVVLQDNGYDLAAPSLTALAAADWVNQLRAALDQPSLSLGDMQMLASGLAETPRTLRGIASWYGPDFHGRQTATGEIFDQNNLTAAHPSLPFGTYLKVRNLTNGRTVVVRVNDRGPYVGERSLDLSYAAAQCLGSDTVGVIPYEATLLQSGRPQRWQPDLVTANARLTSQSQY